jgi:hypothetical protein
MQQSKLQNQILPMSLEIQTLVTAGQISMIPLTDDQPYENKILTVNADYPGFEMLNRPRNLNQSLNDIPFSCY